MNNPPAPSSNPPTRASELVDYDFCERAWWLKHVQNIEPARREALAHGVAVHLRHKNQVEAAGRWQGVGLALLGLGVLLLAGVLALNGL